MTMFQLHYSNTSPEVAATGMPDEDTILAQDSFMAVFDGVTLEHTSPYPSPSPAKQAADIAASSAYTLYKDSREACIGTEKDLIKQLFIQADEAIYDLNKRLGVTSKTVNYLDKQYASAVGAVAFIKDSILYYGQMTDCGVLVLDDMLRPITDAIFDTDMYDDYVADIEQRLHLTRGSEQEYVYIRKNLVNNPDVKVNNRNINFGVLTGETVATQFLKIGQQKLHDGYTIILYSDGFIPYLHHQDFIHLLASGADTEIETYIRNAELRSSVMTFERSLVCLRFSAPDSLAAAKNATLHSDL